MIRADDEKSQTEKDKEKEKEKKKEDAIERGERSKGGSAIKGTYGNDDDNDN